MLQIGKIKAKVVPGGRGGDEACDISGCICPCSIPGKSCGPCSRNLSLVWGNLQQFCAPGRQSGEYAMYWSFIAAVLEVLEITQSADTKFVFRIWPISTRQLNSLPNGLKLIPIAA
jgi:hypothetical protein